MLPLLLGGGMRLTDGLQPDANLVFEGEPALEGGSVEIVYRVSAVVGDTTARGTDWAPASQLRDRD